MIRELSWIGNDKRDSKNGRARKPQGAHQGEQHPAVGKRVSCLFRLFRLGKIMEAKSTPDKSGPCVVWVSGSFILGSLE